MNKRQTLLVNVFNVNAKLSIFFFKLNPLKNRYSVIYDYLDVATNFLVLDELTD